MQRKLSNMILISHAIADDSHVDRIGDGLQSAGIPTWIDHRDIAPGEIWVKAIEAARFTATAALLVLSNESALSKFNLQECLYFLNARKPLYLAQIEPIAEDRLHARLHGLERIALYPDFAAGLQTLIEVVKSDTQPIESQPVSPVRVTIEISGDADEIERRVRKVLAEMTIVDGDKLSVTRSAG